MAAAEVGDDVFGDDPTVERARGARGRAARQGRGAVRLQRDAGQPRLADGAPAARLRAIAGAPPTPCSTRLAATRWSSARRCGRSSERPDGTLDPAEIAAAFRDPSDLHEPITGLVTLENTNAHTGGRPLTVEYTRTVAALAHERGVPLHIDGARFFNAVVALGVTPAELAAPADTRDVLPVQGPVGARSGPSWSATGRSSPAPVGRASCSAAACARSACWPRPGLSPFRRRCRDDRAAGRGPRERAAAGRGPRRPRRHPLAGRDRPAGRWPARSGARRDRLRPVQAWTGIGRRSSTPSRRGACGWSRTRTGRSAP